MEEITYYKRPKSRQTAETIKREIRTLLQKHIKDEPDDEIYILVSVFGELTSEIGMEMVGPKLTTALFLELAGMANQKNYDE